MERTPEEALRYLSLLYNEDFLYMYQEHRSAPVRPVQVSVISVTRNEIPDRHSDNKYARLHDVRVRVSAVEEISGREYPWREMNEIKWEGKLQDWYQACADMVTQITTGDTDSDE
jgi:hypothetical protein